MTQKLVKIVGSYSIDAFVMFKSVTNDNFSSSTCLNFENFCLNGPSVTVELPLKLSVESQKGIIVFMYHGHFIGA